MTTNNATLEVYKRWISELEKFSIERKNPKPFVINTL